LCATLKNRIGDNLQQDLKDKKTNTPPHKAKVCQPVPATIPSLPNTCFLPPRLLRG
jgi:hypothetical protein